MRCVTFRFYIQQIFIDYSHCVRFKKHEDLKKNFLPPRGPNRGNWQVNTQLQYNMVCMAIQLSLDAVEVFIWYFATQKWFSETVISEMDLKELVNINFV